MTRTSPEQRQRSNHIETVGGRTIELESRGPVGATWSASIAPADALGMRNSSAMADNTPSQSIDFFAMSPGVLVDETFLSEGTRISVKTIRNWRSARTGPRPLRLGGFVRYRVSDITTWIDACTEEA